MRSSFLLPAGFFTAGLDSWSTLQQTETRSQILVFITLIGVMTLASARMTVVSAAVCSDAVTAGILVAKFSIEGWPI